MTWGSLVTNIQDVLSTLVDCVLPPRIHTLRTKTRTVSEIPLCVATHRLLGADIVTIMDYQKPAVRDLIRSLKYDGSGYAAHICAQLLADYLQEELATIHVFSPCKIVLVPLPLHPTRKRERGFNQIEVILKRLPDEFQNASLCTISTDTLIRTRATQQQAHLTRERRIQNVHGAFEVSSLSSIKGAHIFLIDDVTTTGATLVSAGAALMHAGAQVHLLALARA